MEKPVVIFVDDEKIVLDAIRDQMRRHFNSSLSFESAKSAEEALELLEELSEENIVVPLIISDHIMPNMKGDELLIKIHERYPEMKKILLTGQADGSAVGNALNNAHLFRFVSKPWSELDLAQTVKEALKSYNSEQELNSIYKELDKLTYTIEKHSLNKEPLVDTEEKNRVELFNRVVDQLIAAKDSAESMAKAKARFLSTISHELRTPLNGIIGISEILRENNPRQDQIENINALNFSSQTLLMLINDILDFSKMEAGKMTLESINVRLDELVENIAKVHKGSTVKKGIDLSVHIDDTLPEVISDPTRISQILNNLLSNAIKFTSKGSVKMELKVSEQTKNSCTVDFAISDTGIGIPEDRLNSIFETFTQASKNISRSFGGTGLGLAITKQLVSLLGGDIKVKSAAGKGSVFYFSIPFDKAVDDVKVTPINDLYHFNNEPVLYAEDNEINALIADQLFRKWGLDITIVSNGKEALEAMATQRFRLVLMDCQMPVMDGYEATREIRKKDHEIPIVALTASVLPEDHERIKKSGMNSAEQKPFNTIRINNTIAKYLGYKKAV